MSVPDLSDLSAPVMAEDLASFGGGAPGTSLKINFDVSILGSHSGSGSCRWNSTRPCSPTGLPASARPSSAGVFSGCPTAVSGARQHLRGCNGER
jgi:hypothetical protein